MVAQLAVENDPFAAEQEDRYWRQNLFVCVAGSFTTIVAMTLLLPFLPLYVEQLGVSNRAAIAQWSGIAYGATFFAAALVATALVAGTAIVRLLGGQDTDVVVAPVPAFRTLKIEPRAD